MDVRVLRLQWITVLVFGYISIASAQGSTHLNVSFIVEPPYWFEKNGTLTGFMADVLSRVSEITGHTFTFHAHPDRDLGELDAPNGSWTGLTGELINGTIDVIAPLMHSSQRYNDVEFSVPVVSSGPAIFMRHPDPDYLSYSSFTESLSTLLVPLEFSVWLLTVLAFLVTSTLLYIISYTNPYEWRRMAKDKEATIREAESFSCMNSFWFVISTMAWQGYVRAPRSIGARIIVTTWWFFVIIFLLSYTASLTNYFSVGGSGQHSVGSKPFGKVKDFKDLAEEDDIGVGMFQDGAIQNFFKSSKSSVHTKLSEKANDFWQQHSDIKTMDDVLKYIKKRDSNFAWIMDSFLGRYYTSVKCDLYSIADDLITRHWGLGFRKGAKYASDINTAIAQMHENDEMNFLANKWLKNACANPVYFPEPTVIKLKRFHQIDMATFSGPLLILTVGMILGGIVSIVEYCIYKYAEKHPDEENEHLVADHRASVNAAPYGNGERANGRLQQAGSRGGETSQSLNRKGGATAV